VGGVSPLQGVSRQLEQGRQVMQIGDSFVRRRLAAAVLMPLIVGIGCASQPTTRQSSTPAIQAAQEIPIEQLLDVGITVFDPGLPAEGQPIPDDVFPELRKAESRFQAIQLMETMQSTGQWGAIRVLFPARFSTPPDSSWPSTYGRWTPEERCGSNGAIGPRPTILPT